jgi:hypothetical protein
MLRPLDRTTKATQRTARACWGLEAPFEAPISQLCVPLCNALVNKGPAFPRISLCNALVSQLCVPLAVLLRSADELRLPGAGHHGRR